MEKIWQCTCAYAAVDGTQIPIKCPPGGGEAAKEYFCYKNVYSIILMGVVDARCRFLWASCGSPGSAHDATVFKVSNLYKKLNNYDYFPELSTEINGDSSFPHHSWLQKPYSHAVTSAPESYYNYRSRGRIVVEHLRVAITTEAEVESS